MQFDTFQYWLFFATTFLLFTSLKQQSARILLLVGSYIFYGFWDVRFLLLLGGATLFNFIFGILIESSNDKKKKLLLALTIAANLSLLSFFKYFNFFVSTFASLFNLNSEALFLNIILPVGISFFTFEGIAYAVDIYRGEIKARRSVIDYALFISFFPHLIAGPIIRPHDYFPQLDKKFELQKAFVQWSIYQIVKGLFKKLVLADGVAIYADRYFSGDSSIGVWAGVIAFGLQIYFDFSGYTDIARGCARLFGIYLPLNFNRPYLSRNISDFWRSWHISLSSWLRDYLFIPLGGSRVSKLKTHRNLFIVMVLGGLWHGASWGFALWGLWHGFLLSAHKLFKDFSSPKMNQLFATKFGAIVSWMLTLVVVFAGWIPFRANGFQKSVEVLLDFFSFWKFELSKFPLSILVAIVVSAIYTFLDRRKSIENMLERGVSWVVFVPIIGSVLWLIDVFMVRDISIPFIYFQF